MDTKKIIETLQAEIAQYRAGGIDTDAGIAAIDAFVFQHGNSPQLESYRETLRMVKRAHVVRAEVEADIAKLEARREAATEELAAVGQECAEKIAAARAEADAEIAKVKALSAEAKSYHAEVQGAGERLRSARAEADAVVSSIKG